MPMESPRPAVSPSPGARAFRAVLAIELRLLLRDRRAMLLAVVLPTALYPLVFLGQRSMEGASRRAMEERRVIVACDLDGLAARARLVDLLRLEAPIDVLAVDATPLRAIEPGGPASRREREIGKSLAGGPGGIVLVGRGGRGDPSVPVQLYVDRAYDGALHARWRGPRGLVALHTPDPAGRG